MELGSFWFWYGEYVQNTAAVPDATPLDLMFTLRF
jgi:hypothetical protein